MKLDIRKLPLIISERSMTDQDLADWIGSSYEKINIVSNYNLLYNAVVMVAGGMGIAGGIKLNCKYDKVTFVPARPPVKNNSVLAWKKTISQSHTVSTFIEFCVLYANGIASNNL